MSVEQYELIIDMLGRPLLANSRLHHQAKGRVVREWRRAGFVAARAAGVPRLSRVAVACWGRYPTRVLPDVDAPSPALKAVLDGVVDAGVIPDDRPPFVQSVTYYEPIHERGCRPALVVLLTALFDDVAHPGRSAA